MRLPGPSDVVGALQAQTEALAQLPVTVLALNRTVRDLVAIVAQARETFDTLNRIANRADSLLDDFEEPVAELLPGMRKAAEVLNDPVIGEIPSTVRSVTEDIVPVVRGLREAQERLTGFATATERLTGFPGSAFLRGRRSARADPDTSDADAEADDDAPLDDAPVDEAPAEDDGPDGTAPDGGASASDPAEEDTSDEDDGDGSGAGAGDDGDEPQA